MAQEPDSRAVAGLRAGNARAFEEIYHAYRPRLFGFLVRMSGRRDVAEELLQEIWFRLARNAPRLRADTRIGAWLFTVARNLILSYRRRQILDGEQLERLARVPIREPQSPFEDTAASEFERRVERGLAGLPYNYREALLLVGVEGLAPSEAAVICRISPEALRQRLARGRVLLARELAGVGPVTSAAEGRSPR